MKTKNVYVIAGPNGSGKTTFAKKFLPDYAKCLSYYKPLADTWLLFNNADAVPRLIAQEKNGKTEILDKVLFEKIMRTLR